jgi:hypothetical protein
MEQSNIPEKSFERTVLSGFQPACRGNRIHVVDADLANDLSTAPPAEFCMAPTFRLKG